jgi:hypothetical protein
VKKLFFLPAAFAYGSCWSVAPEFGRIEVVVKDSIGGSIDFTGATNKRARVDLVEIGSKQSFKITEPIPYGTYAMRVSVRGYNIFRREITLDQPKLIVRADLSLETECLPP